MKFLKQATYIRYISKTIKTCPNHDTDFLSFFLRDLKIKKGLELVSRAQFLQNFFMKSFFLKYYITSQI